MGGPALSSSLSTDPGELVAALLLTCQSIHIELLGILGALLGQIGNALGQALPLVASTDPSVLPSIKGVHRGKYLLGHWVQQLLSQDERYRKTTAGHFAIAGVPCFAEHRYCSLFLCAPHAMLAFALIMRAVG